MEMMVHSLIFMLSANLANFFFYRHQICQEMTLLRCIFRKERGGGGQIMSQSYTIKIILNVIYKLASSIDKTT